MSNLPLANDVSPGIASPVAASTSDSGVIVDAPPVRRVHSTAPSRGDLATATSTWLPWWGLLGLTLALAGFSFVRTEGTIFADAVEYLERALAFVRGELLVDAKQLRSAGITLLHLPALFLSQVLGKTLGVEETRWILPYAAAVHVMITWLFVVATVHLGRALASFVGEGDASARNVGWFAGLVALASPTLLQFSAIPMADIGAAAALAYGVNWAFLARTTARNGAKAGLGFGLAILAAFKTIPVVVVATALAFIVRLQAPSHGIAGEPAPSFKERLRATVRFAASGSLALAAMLVLQCAFDLAAYGQFGIGLSNYVIVNTLPQIAAYMYKIGFIELGHTLYDIAYEVIEESSADQISRNAEDLIQANRASWYFDHFAEFAPRWLVPVFAFGTLVAAVRALFVHAHVMRGRLGKMISASAPWVAAAALIAATAMKGTKEMRIWLPMLPAFAAYSALGLATIAGKASAPGARLRGALVACALIVAPIQGVKTLTGFTSTSMASLAHAAEWLNEYEPLKSLAASGQKPVVGASYHWSVLFRTAPHLELIKLTNQPDGSFSHLDSAEEREITLEEIRGLDAFIVHSALLRRDAFLGEPELEWARELSQTLSENFHVAAAFWNRESDELRFGPILVLVRHPDLGDRRRVLAEFSEANPRNDSTPLIRMERPLMEIFEQVELEDARATWLPGDDLLWVEFDFDQIGPRIIADYVILVRVTGKDSDQGAVAIRRPGWNKRRMIDMETGSRLTEGFVLAPYQGAISAADTSDPVRAGDPVRLWLDIVTVDASDAGVLFPTGRLEPLDPKWRGVGPGQMYAERDSFDPETGVSDDGHRFTRDFGHLLIGEVPPPGEEDQNGGSGNVLRVEAALRPQ
ncbi:hypothetical protein [Planctomycetes bacterium Poly30]